MLDEVLLEVLLQDDFLPVGGPVLNERRLEGPFLLLEDLMLRPVLDERGRPEGTCSLFLDDRREQLRIFAL